MRRFLTVMMCFLLLTGGLFAQEPPEGYVLVEGGTFTMGSPTSEAGRNDDEVTVGSFYMKATEVTQGEWRAVMGSNPSDFAGDDRPVERVSWYDAVEYCNALSEREGLRAVYTINKSGTDPGNESDYDNLKWTVTADWSANGYRLPTEAEWEYAARGGNRSRGYTYSGSNTVGDAGWYEGNSGRETHPVGGKQPNELGLYDMSGNVYEWCWDWYGAYPTAGSQTDPRGPLSGSFRISRGGGWSWLSSAQSCRAAARNSDFPTYSDNSSGFRPVRTR